MLRSPLISTLFPYTTLFRSRNGLIEDYGERPVVLYAQLPRPTASLNSSVVRRGFRRPVEPCGDREIEGRDGNCGSRDSISRVEVPSPTDFPGGIRCAGERPSVSLARQVFHLSAPSET